MPLKNYKNTNIKLHFIISYVNQQKWGISFRNVIHKIFAVKNANFSKILSCKWFKPLGKSLDVILFWRAWTHLFKKHIKQYKLGQFRQE